MPISYFIADLHLGSHGIVKRRPEFSSLHEMHEKIISNWNSIVHAQDTVYVLGDVIFNVKYLYILEILKGKKVLIAGNHDTDKLKYMYPYFYRIEGALSKKIHNVSCILTHIPIHPAEFYTFKFNIHGHLHHKIIWENNVWDTRYINVCVEHTNYSPVSNYDLGLILKLRTSNE